MKRRMLSILYIFLGSLALLFSPLTKTEAVAAHTDHYEYKIGEEPVEGPVVSMAFNGERIEMRGAGTFTTHPNSVTGSGTVTHKNAAGDVINTGTWTATRLWNFQSWGTGGGFPSNFEGGKALIGVHLKSSDGTIEADGLLWVTCLIGNVPAGAHEGIKLLISRFGLYFNSEISGETLFIRMP